LLVISFVDCAEVVIIFVDCAEAFLSSCWMPCFVQHCVSKNSSHL